MDLINEKELVQLETSGDDLAEIAELDAELLNHFNNKIQVNPALNRRLVSFQANKPRAVYRWYKFKEAFSAALVEYLLGSNNIISGNLLDPFAGSGTALFAAAELGIDTEGIELLPIGQNIIEAKLILEPGLSEDDTTTIINWQKTKPWNLTTQRISLNKLRITNGAYPKETLDSIERYLKTLGTEKPSVQKILSFALLCILESISYTRKDGQYLRWDYRSGRKQGTKLFNKGIIQTFDNAICNKLKEILDDKEGAAEFELFPPNYKKGKISLHKGSCLEILPKLSSVSYNVIFTSPPYCNRYDYTRTYALELALQGISEAELLNLRQQMLSCTVENRPKDLLKLNPNWDRAISAVDNLPLLQVILHYLENQKVTGQLNNNGIPRMVRGYFYEMACVIAECARTLKDGALLIMVNDNVRYAGASISVDLILSKIAEGCDFEIENIFVLPNGKGNSSQQMGVHGRDTLRKCVYLWRKK